MKVYAILRESDTGRALPDGFKAESSDGTELALMSALLETLGYYVDFETCDSDEAAADIETFHNTEDEVGFASLDREEDETEG